MPEDSTTPDLAELNRRLLDAGNRRDLEVAMSLIAPDAVYEARGPQLRLGAVLLGEGGLIGRVKTYIDPDEARAAAERLAEERA